MQAGITAKLTKDLDPTFVQVMNESFMHNVPRGSETHFKVVVVSDRFSGVPLVDRHRMVHSCLQAELAGPVHALAIVAKTPEQWAKQAGPVESSPSCRGGFGK